MRPWIHLLVSAVRSLWVSFNGFDHKCNAEIEGVDLTALFDEAVTLPLKVLSKLPKDLLSLVNDCGIILI